MLTKDEIRLILSKLSLEIVVEKSQDFPFHIVREGFGYSEDEAVGKLQAKLSIMLEVASRREK